MSVVRQQRPTRIVVVPKSSEGPSNSTTVPSIGGNPGVITCRRFRMYSQQELAAATDNFRSDRLLGSGKDGEIYFGKLSDATAASELEEAAIKVLHSTPASKHNFHCELKLLQRIRHPNIVALRGWKAENASSNAGSSDGNNNNNNNSKSSNSSSSSNSNDTSSPTAKQASEVYPAYSFAFVFGFAAGGDVAKALRENETGGSFGAERRLGVGIDLAAALSYLSSLDPCIFHRDIKPSNVLLDHSFRAKLADFGIAVSCEGDRKVKVKQAAGSLGYAAPEYISSLEVTEASEVYSFGIVLLELLTNVPPSRVGAIGETLWPLIALLQPAAPGAVARTMVHLDDAAGLWPQPKTKLVAELALSCVDGRSESRPTFNSVERQLRQFQQQTSAPVPKVSPAAKVVVVKATPASSTNGQSTRRAPSHVPVPLAASPAPALEAAAERPTVLKASPVPASPLMPARSAAATAASTRSRSHSQQSQPLSSLHSTHSSRSSSSSHSTCSRAAALPPFAPLAPRPSLPLPATPVVLPRLLGSSATTSCSSKDGRGAPPWTTAKTTTTTTTPTRATEGEAAATAATKVMKARATSIEKNALRTTVLEWKVTLTATRVDGVSLGNLDFSEYTWMAVCRPGEVLEVGRIHQPELFTKLFEHRRELLGAISRVQFRLSLLGHGSSLQVTRFASNPIEVDGRLLDPRASVAIRGSGEVSFLRPLDEGWGQFATFKISLDLCRPGHHVAIPSRQKPTSTLALVCCYSSGLAPATLRKLGESQLYTIRIPQPGEEGLLLGRARQSRLFEDLLAHDPHRTSFVSRSHCRLSAILGDDGSLQLRLEMLSTNVLRIDRLAPATSSLSGCTACSSDPPAFTTNNNSSNNGNSNSSSQGQQQQQKKLRDEWEIETVEALGDLFDTDFNSNVGSDDLDKTLTVGRLGADAEGSALAPALTSASAAASGGEVEAAVASKPPCMPSTLSLSKARADQSLQKTLPYNSLPDTAATTTASAHSSTASSNASILQASKAKEDKPSSCYQQQQQQQPEHTVGQQLEHTVSQRASYPQLSLATGGSTNDNSNNHNNNTNNINNNNNSNNNNSNSTSKLNTSWIHLSETAILSPGDKLSFLARQPNAAAASSAEAASDDSDDGVFLTFQVVLIPL